VTMTPEEAHELLAEAKLRNDTVGAAVELLNLFGEFLASPSNSPVEDQLEMALNDAVQKLIEDGITGLGGHVMLCLASIICETANPEQVQRFLTDQEEAIQAMVKEARGGHTN
jgi:hypothetical protein